MILRVEITMRVISVIMTKLMTIYIMMTMMIGKTSVITKAKR